MAGSFNILRWIVMVMSTALVYFASYQVGVDRTKYDDSRPCPAREVRIIPINVTNTPNIVPHTVTKSISSCPAKCTEPLPLDRMWSLRLGKATVPEDIFDYLHHPSSPAKQNFFMAEGAAKYTADTIGEMPCQELYLTRTGSRSSQPNKCISIVTVPNGLQSIVQQSHRVGYTALNTNQYQQDFPRDYGKKKDAERQLLYPLLSNRQRLINMLRSKLGDPTDPKTGKIRSVIVMVANVGVLDLLMNFLCSARQANIPFDNIIIFVGDEAVAATVQSMGVAAFTDPALGLMPSQAADSYLDMTFSRMMWFKAVAVYLTLSAGYQVLFQDVDLVWMRNPFSYFEEQPADLIFMDDGARTPRYTPFFVNSGFYVVKQNPRTVFLFEKLMKAAAAEIGQTHSHQSVLIRHIAEAHHLFSVSVFVLDMELFPSGQAYHENKPLIKRIQSKEYRPYVFHM